MGISILGLRGQFFNAYTQKSYFPVTSHSMEIVTLMDSILREVNSMAPTDTISVKLHPHTTACRIQLLVTEYNKKHTLSYYKERGLDDNSEQKIVRHI